MSNKKLPQYYHSLSDLNIEIPLTSDSPDELELASERECSSCGYPFYTHSTAPVVVCSRCKRPWKAEKPGLKSKRYIFSKPVHPNKKAR